MRWELTFAEKLKWFAFFMLVPHRFWPDGVERGTTDEYLLARGGYWMDVECGWYRYVRDFEDPSATYFITGTPDMLDIKRGCFWLTVKLLLTSAFWLAVGWMVWA